MKYDATTGRFSISQADMQLAADQAKFAMRKIRSMAGLPMHPYKQDGLLTDADHAQKAILDACAHMGICMGSLWGHKLDLREEGEL